MDEDQEEGTSEPCCTVLLGLMQKNRRRQRRIGQGMLSIGYAVYQIPKELENHTDEHLGRDFFQGRQPSTCSSTYMNLREVSSRVQLPPGQYLVVPSTFEPFKDGDFCLRVFSEKKAQALCVYLVNRGWRGWFSELGPRWRCRIWRNSLLNDLPAPGA